MRKRLGEAIRDVFDQPMHHPERAREDGESVAPLFKAIVCRQIFQTIDEYQAIIGSFNEILYGMIHLLKVVGPDILLATLP